MNLDFTKLWPTILVVLTSLVDVFSGQITAFLVAHPSIGLAAVNVITLLANATKGVTKQPTP